MLNFSMKRKPHEGVKTGVSNSINASPKQLSSAELGHNEQTASQIVTPDCDWWHDELETAFDAAAEKLALSGDQSQGLKALFIETVCLAQSEEAAEIDQSRQNVLRQLEQSWGQNAEHQFAAVNQAAAALNMDSEALEAILATSQAVLIVKALSKLGEAMAEDGALPLEANHQGMSKENAKNSLNRLQADKNHIGAYLNPNHPGHESAKLQRRALIDMTLS